MGAVVVMGATLTCPFGTMPVNLSVTSQSSVMAEGKPVATIQDFSPNVNIPGFGMCSSLANPQVASATAAALGVLTPQQCIPAVAAPWVPAQTICLAENKPCLTGEAAAVCVYGGMIAINDTGQKTVIIS